jgi:biotin operon repressor
MKERRVGAQSFILEALRTGPLTGRELAEVVGMETKGVRENLCHLRGKGWRIVQDGYRQPYRLLDSPDGIEPIRPRMDRRIFLDMLRSGVWRTRNIADEFGVTPQSVTTMVGRLIADGYQVVNLGDAHNGAVYTIVPPVRTWSVCAHPGCNTTLNRYHDGTLCYLHEGPRPSTILEAMLYVMEEDVYNENNHC